jgi:hypothetical protein
MLMIYEYPYCVLVCDYVDIGADRPMDFILTSPSEDPSFPVVNVIKTNGK